MDNSNNVNIETNTRAQAFKALHVPGDPLLLVNVHDQFAARAVASLPECRAIATASFSLALANNTDDAHLDLDTYLGAVQGIATVAHQAAKPLTVDLQDGYGDRLEEAVKKMISLGVVGVNLEDSEQKTQAVMNEDVAIDRIKRALAAATEAGVPDFVINARSDTFLRGGTLDESIRKGKLFLEAGAATIYILGGGPDGLTREQVQKCVQELQGRVNVGLRLPQPDAESKALTSKDFADLGVARVSIGPQLYFATIAAVKKVATTVLNIS